jgi:hypothetical protein
VAPLLRALGVLAVVLAVVGLVGALGLPVARAADGGLLRVAHLSPDTPAVDVSVAAESDPATGIALAGLGYGTVSDYRNLPPGTYTVSMRRAGAAASTPPALTTTVQVAAGSARTVAAVGSFADLGLRVLDDDLTPPPPGRARLRVVAAAATTPALDVALPGGESVVSGLAFPRSSDYVDVPAGSTALSVAPAGAQATPLPVDLAAGSIYTVLVLDRPGGGLTVRPLVDAAGPALMPKGSVPAGEGGAAGTRNGTLAAVAAGVAVLAAVGLLLTFRLCPARRSGRSRPSAGG